MNILMDGKEANFRPDVVMDGALITGQNPASSKPVARALLARQATR
jgi:putative intracellular protease/amidase